MLTLFVSLHFKQCLLQVFDFAEIARLCWSRCYPRAEWSKLSAKRYSFSWETQQTQSVYTLKRKFFLKIFSSAECDVSEIKEVCYGSCDKVFFQICPCLKIKVFRFSPIRTRTLPTLHRSTRNRTPPQSGKPIAHQRSGKLSNLIVIKTFVNIGARNGLIFYQNRCCWKL